MRARAITPSEGVLAERELAAPLWVGTADTWPDATGDSGEVCALVYGDGEVHVVPPCDRHAAATAVRAAGGTAVVFLPSLLAGPTRRRADPKPSAKHSSPLHDAWSRGGRYVVPLDARRSWTERLVRLETELRIPAPANAEAAEALLRLLLIDAARLAETAPSAPPSQVVIEAAAVIDQRFRGPLSLADVAAVLSISPSQLSRVVRRARGCSVGEWIRDRRMEEARRLLRETEASVESIAGQIGYRDVAHFRRHFLRAHETTPARWRERARPGLGTRIR